MKNGASIAAEFIGTFAMVFCGTGAIVINEFSGGAIGHPGIAFSFGLVVMAVIYALGQTSGAHINPAVTIGFWVSGLFSGSRVTGYLLAQFAGAMLASGLLAVFFPDTGTLGETIPSISWASAFGFEVILTFLLMLVILFVATGTRDQQSLAGIAIGGTVGLEALFAGPVTGASMNPARSLAPAIFSGNLEEVWIYLAAPTLGALLAVVSFKLMKQPNETES